MDHSLEELADLGLNHDNLKISYSDGYIPVENIRNTLAVLFNPSTEYTKITRMLHHYYGAAYEKEWEGIVVIGIEGESPSGETFSVNVNYDDEHENIKIDQSSVKFKHEILFGCKNLVMNSSLLRLEAYFLQRMNRPQRYNLPTTQELRK